MAMDFAFDTIQSCWLPNWNFTIEIHAFQAPLHCSAANLNRSLEMTLIASTRA